MSAKRTLIKVMTGGLRPYDFHSERIVNMNEVRRLVPRTWRMCSNWWRTGAAWSAATVVGALYYMDWKVVSENIPFYGRQFAEEHIRKDC